jgi:hypothetical protein
MIAGFGLFVSFLGGLLMAVPYWKYGPARDDLLVSAAAEKLGVNDEHSERLKAASDRANGALTRSVIGKIDAERRFFKVGLSLFCLGQLVQFVALCLSEA